MARAKKPTLGEELSDLSAKIAEIRATVKECYGWLDWVEEEGNPS